MSPSNLKDEDNSYYNTFEEDEESPLNILEGFGEYNATTYNNSFDGIVFLMSKNMRLKDHFGVVNGKEVFFYRRKDDKKHKLMHSLIGTFVKALDAEIHAIEEGPEEEFWPLKIIFPPNRSRILYFKREANMQYWRKHLKKISDQKNVLEFYKIDKVLGEGEFGVVKLATHKQNGEKVAIKIINKKKMEHVEIFQMRREIEVMKMCQHPNIIKMIDLFETLDNYFIIMEYMDGEDLHNYMTDRKFKVPEKRAAEIAYQIGVAIQYLHSYGIVHRDIKLENIMMTDKSEHSVPKIVDFGLAQMIGPNEQTKDPFGSLGYVAPEVLKKEPYSHKCDLWSYGCLIYALLSRELPFDSDDEKELRNMTMNNPLKFDAKCW